MDVRHLPDLARRDLGGGVIWANDDAFAECQNLITPGPAVFDPTTFGPNGKLYDGWETRRRRSPAADAPGHDDGHDTAIIRLATPGIVRGIVVDTSFFVGNYPPEASVEGICAHDGALSRAADLHGADDWVELVPRSPLKGDTDNTFTVAEHAPITHVRLRIFPDGGVARLRVHGEAVPVPELLDALGTIDLAAMEYGGRVVACSNLFFGSPNNLLLPGPSRSMGEGWETARRRDDGNDWVEVALAGEGVVTVAEIDTGWYLHNAPGAATLSGRIDDDAPWTVLLERTALLPDTRHRFVLRDAAPVTQVRLDIFPDGGVARMRLIGRLTDHGRAELVRRWAPGEPPHVSP